MARDKLTAASDAITIAEHKLANARAAFRARATRTNWERMVRASAAHRAAWSRWISAWRSAHVEA